MMMRSVGSRGSNDHNQPTSPTTTTSNGARVAIGTPVYKRWGVKWYAGMVKNYNPYTKRYHIKYEERGEEEVLPDSKELDKIIAYAVKKKQQDERFERADPLEFDYDAEYNEALDWHGHRPYNDFDSVAHPHNKELCFGWYRLRERALKFRFYYQEDPSLLHDALEVYNRRQVRQVGSDFIVDRLYIYKPVERDHSYGCAECEIMFKAGKGMKFCYDACTERGMRRYETKLCPGCMGRRLKVVVGTDREAIERELQELRDRQPLNGFLRPGYYVTQYYEDRLNGMQIPVLPYI